MGEMSKALGSASFGSKCMYVPSTRRCAASDMSAVHTPTAWGATVRGTYPTPEAGTCTPYVLYVGPWGRAALGLRYVHNAGGWYA